jgi:hypothetical protein
VVVAAHTLEATSYVMRFLTCASRQAVAEKRERGVQKHPTVAN